MSNNNTIRFKQTIKYYPYEGGIKSVTETIKLKEKEKKLCNSFDSYANSLGIPPRKDNNNNNNNNNNNQIRLENYGSPKLVGQPLYQYGSQESRKMVYINGLGWIYV